MTSKTHLCICGVVPETLTSGAMRWRERHVLSGTYTFQWIGGMEVEGKQPVCQQAPSFSVSVQLFITIGWHQTSASLTFQLRLGKCNSPGILQALYTWIKLLRHLISWPRNLVLCSAHPWFTQWCEYRKQTTEIHETSIFGGKVYSWKQMCTEICVTGAE